VSNDFIHTKNPSDIVSLTYAGVSTRKTDNGFFFSLALQTKTKVKYLYVYFQHLIYSDRLIALNKHSIKQRFFSFFVVIFWFSCLFFPRFIICIIKYDILG